MPYGLGMDLRYALRVLRRSPGFALVAIVSLAVGIGANTAMFGVVKTLLLTPLPVEAPEELALLGWTRGGEFSITQTGTTSYLDPATGVDHRSNFSHPLYGVLRESAPGDVELFAFAFVQRASVAIGDRPALVAGSALADGAYFSGLRLPMEIGRPLVDADNVLDAPLVAVLSHSFWMRAFGGDPEIIGRVVRVNGHPTEVVGVTRAGFKGLSLGGFFPQTEITLPLSAQPRAFSRMGEGDALFTSERDFWLRIMVRVPSTTTWASVEQALGTTFRSHPSPLVGGDGLPPDLRLLPGDQGAQPVRPERARLLYFLLGVVGVVLLIACLNLATLMLARGVSRQREIAVRRALGGGRGRLVRGILLEGLVLAVLGTGAGLLVTVLARQPLGALLTGSLGAAAFGDVELGVSVDPIVLGLGIALGTGAILLCGVVPALRLSKVDPGAWLKHRADAATPRLTGGRALITMQIAVSVPLVVGAALFLRTVANIGAVELGFDPRGLATLEVNPGYTRLPQDQYATLYMELLAGLEALPEVRSATLIEHPLMSGVVSNQGIIVDGERQVLYRNAVGPAFVETLGMRLIAGRAVGYQDAENTPLVGMVNETAVREIFAGESPIGRLLELGSRDVQIVGIVNDTPYRSRRAPIPSTLYESAFQRAGFGGHDVVLRTDAPIARLELAVREVVSRVNPDLPVPELRTQTALMAQTGARERVFTQMLSLFGVFALVLASIGLHGVTSYSVARRTSEIGVRVAVGARPRDVAWLVLRQVLLLAAVGLAVGIPVALAAGPFVGSLLYGVAPRDVGTIALSSVILLAVVTAAGLLPAVKAARLDAAVALARE